MSWDSLPVSLADLDETAWQHRHRVCASSQLQDVQENMHELKEVNQHGTACMSTSLYFGQDRSDIYLDTVRVQDRTVKWLKAVSMH